MNWAHIHLLLFRTRLIPRPLVGATLVFALAVAGWMAQTANLGGRIRHSELGGAGAAQAEDRHGGREGRDGAGR